jgi:hypothetical protein
MDLLPCGNKEITTKPNTTKTLPHRRPDATAASTSMCTKGSFASSSAPENSHTPQQSKVGGDDEVVSTDSSASPQNGKIVQDSAQDPATHVTSSSGAAGLPWSGDKDLDDVPNITDYDWEPEVDPPPPAPGDSESLSTSTLHRFTAERPCHPLPSPGSLNYVLKGFYQKKSGPRTPCPPGGPPFLGMLAWSAEWLPSARNWSFRWPLPLISCYFNAFFR